MTVRPILTYPDPVLRRRAEPVGVHDADLRELVADLLDTLRATGGIGLSAPQLGVSRRVAVTEPTGGAAAPQVYVDPVILERSALGFVEESCLSVPGIVGSVWRHTQIRVGAHDANGAEFECRLDGMAAVCLQHELDHLDGKLFIDRLWPLKRFLVRRRLDSRPVARAA